MTPRVRALTITYSTADLAAVALLAMVVGIWLSIAAGTVSVLAFAASAAMFFTFYFTGSLLAGFRRLADGISFDLPLRLLLGYAVINTALFALAWLSPLGIVANFMGLVALILAVFFGVGRREKVDGHVASLCVVALSLIATSLWCQDSISPRVEEGHLVSFKPWVDGFYHAVHIRIFGASHGAASLEDWRLAGVSARPYHYGMYLLPAFIKQVSGVASYAAFSGVLAPVGVFFTGLSAYSFFGSLFGSWSGLTAAGALLLLPDGAQQGMRNTFMSYHWLTQISPSATYGLALLVVAWLFVVQGCVRGSRLQLFAGWLLAAIVLVYKLHYLFASGFLLLLVPALFFGGGGWRKRAGWILGACALYGLAISVGQKVPGVPLIRFDGSSVGEILRLVQTFAKPGALRDWVVAHMGAKVATASNLLFGIPYVLLAVLGLLLPALVVLVLLLRRRVPVLYWLFPLLLIANFLVMFFGLALDFASSTPDELSHRPLMIVYFFVVSWVGGAVGFAFADWAPGQGRLRFLAPALGLLLLAVPARFGAGVQQMWAMPRMSPTKLTSSLVSVADFMREHGEPEDVFQDSQFDRIYALAALSERRTFVAHTMTLMPFRADLVEARTASIHRFMGMRQPKAMRATARAFGFRWFLLEPGDQVAWPPEIAENPVLEAGPLKLYDF